MKNIHVLPTDKPGRILFDMEENRYLPIQEEDFWMEHQDLIQNRHIYITSDEVKAKEGEWVYNIINNTIYKAKDISFAFEFKIILTTDQDLIKDGVQAIDDEFLKWFVKNPSCEFVEIKLQHQYHTSKEYYIDADYVDCTKEQYNSIKSEIPTCPLRILYKIIIPQEEPKQETLEEAAENFVNSTRLRNYKVLFIEGAKWQADRMYSEEEVQLILSKLLIDIKNGNAGNSVEWFEQFKKNK
jgi:hypothetical protein